MTDTSKAFGTRDQVDPVQRLIGAASALYEGFDQSDGPWATKYRVSLGPDQWPAPPSPTWREHLKSRDYRFETQEDFDRAYREMSLMPEELDQRIDGYSWEDYWEHYESPQAKAHRLLKDLDLDCGPKTPDTKAGTILFTDWAVTPAVRNAGWISRTTSRCRSSKPA